MVDHSCSGLEFMVRSGVSRAGARVLILLAVSGRLQSVEIEDKLCMGQSGVSAAIRELASKGWVRSETIPTQTKGRPRHAYMLSRPFSEIVDQLEDLGDEEIETIRRGVADLRHIAATATPDG